MSVPMIITCKVETLKRESLWDQTKALGTGEALCVSVYKSIMWEY